MMQLHQKTILLLLKWYLSLLLLKWYLNRVEGAPDLDQVIDLDWDLPDVNINLGSSDSESLYYDPFFNDFIQYNEVSYNLNIYQI